MSGGQGRIRTQTIVTPGNSSSHGANFTPPPPAHPLAQVVLQRKAFVDNHSENFLKWQNKKSVEFQFSTKKSKKVCSKKLLGCRNRCSRCKKSASNFRTAIEFYFCSHVKDNLNGAATLFPSDTCPRRRARF